MILWTTLTVVALASGGNTRPDIDGDGVIGTADLLLLLDDWGSGGPRGGGGGGDITSDVDFDGTVEVRDMIEVFKDWAPARTPEPTRSATQTA